VQRAGRHGIGHDDHPRAAKLRGADQLSQHAHVRFVLGRDGERDENEIVGFGLPEKGARLVEAEIAPAFAELCFHVLDQQIETVNIARDRAGNNGRWLGFGLQGQSATHSSFPTLSRKSGWCCHGGQRSPPASKGRELRRSNGRRDRSAGETAHRKGQQ
jgi:hypothetical protein